MLLRILWLLSFAGLSFQNLAQGNPCWAADTVKIVVIGSSTAAGAGASPLDSSWVRRYRHYLEGINPANQVINLARGGYNTWRLMPDYFSPPGNRPSPDTLRNISHALRQNPDAIIINLPSNDAAIGTGLNEQMRNFIHMDSLALSAGVPLWVCTTQPRQFNASGIQIQLAVRDSILSYFGAQAIDFWSGLANAQNTIDSTYDSGDGVHVNNQGHRLLFQRVVQEQILDSLVVGLNGVDLQVNEPQWFNPSLCGSSQSLIEVRIANLGQDSITSPAGVELIRNNLLTNQRDTLRQSLTSLGGCSAASLSFILNSAPLSRWQLSARVLYPNDLSPSNNSSGWIPLETQLQPQINLRDTVACKEDSLTLNASSTHELRWFTDALAQNQIHSGDTLVWPTLRTDTLYLQSFAGPFVFIDQLRASSTHNIKWNGCMFNLIAGADTVYLDSLSFVSGNAADLQVNLRTKSGAYQGFEGNAAAWSAPLSDSVYQAQEDSAYFLDFGRITIPPNDTLGCYLYLENSGHRLAYQWANTTLNNQGNGLSLEAGSGVSHTFGSTFSPRHFAGEFFYHYGQNPQGQCQSEIEPMIIQRSTAQMNLGKDSIHELSLDYIVQLPAGFSNPLWQDGSRGNSLLIPSFSFNDGDSLWVRLTADDSLGCQHVDSLLLRFTLTFDLNEWDRDFALYPNPSAGKIWVKQDLAQPMSLEVYDQSGRRLRSFKGTEREQCYHLDLPSGLYYISINHLNFRPLVLQN